MAAAEQAHVRLALAGRLESMTQSDATERLEALGYTVVRVGSEEAERLDAIVVGRNPSQRAKGLVRRGVMSLGDAELRRLLEGERLIEVLSPSQGRASSRALFARLRGLMTGAPSRDELGRLWTLIDQTPSADLALVVAYVEAHLDRWPLIDPSPHDPHPVAWDAAHWWGLDQAALWPSSRLLLRPPPSWLDELTQGDVTLKHRLIQALDLVEVVLYSGRPWVREPRRLPDHVWTSEHLGGVRFLSLGGPGVTSTVWAKLAALARPQRLEHLALYQLGITPRVARDAQAFAGLPAPHRLVLHDCELSSASLVALAAGPLMERVQALDLSNNHLSAPVAPELDALWRRLDSLVLNHNPFGGDALARLLSALAEGGLERLELVNANLTPSDLLRVLNAPELGRLAWLDLAHAASAVPASLPPLVRLPALTHLNLASNHLTDAHLRDLLRTPAFPALTHLDLGDNSLGPDALEALVASPAAASLEWLNLSNNPLGDRAAAIIAGASLPRLTMLNLSDTAIAHAGGDSLADARDLPALRYLILRFNRLGHAARRRLHERGWDLV